MKRIVTTMNCLFGLLLATALFPTKSTEETEVYLIGFALLLEGIYLVSSFLRRKNAVQIADVISISFFVLLIWELFTAKLGLWDSFLFPKPEIILELFLSDLTVMVSGLGSSLTLLGAGYALALAAAIPFALIVGWNQRLYGAVHPIAKVLSAVPPIVYIPYAIALLPSFRWASILVIFIGAFWPIFVNTLNGVVHIDKKIIDSARMLHIRERHMLFSIILPMIMPEVLTGCSVGLIFSFILLTSAEMIGATSGIGWYVKYYSDFGDYGKVIVGILFIGLVVTVLMCFFERIQAYLLRWKEK